MTGGKLLIRETVTRTEQELELVRLKTETVTVLVGVGGSLSELVKVRVRSSSYGDKEGKEAKYEPCTVVNAYSKNLFYWPFK